MKEIWNTLFNHFIPISQTIAVQWPACLKLSYFPSRVITGSLPNYCHYFPSVQSQPASQTASPTLDTGNKSRLPDQLRPPIAYIGTKIPCFVSFRTSSFHYTLFRDRQVGSTITNPPCPQCYGKLDGDKKWNSKLRRKYFKTLSHHRIIL